MRFSQCVLLCVSVIVLSALCIFKSPEGEIKINVGGLVWPRKPSLPVASAYICVCGWLGGFHRV